MTDERRDFVRLNKQLKVSYKVILDTFAPTNVPANVSYTETVSGNGMLLLNSKDIEDGKKLEMEIYIPDGNEDGVEMTGEVIGRNKIGENEYEIKIKFFDVDEPYRERLVKYIMREDVKSKKK